jgi:hypothetical protein
MPIRNLAPRLSRKRVKESVDAVNWNIQQLDHFVDHEALSCELKRLVPAIVDTSNMTIVQLTTQICRVYLANAFEVLIR